MLTLANSVINVLKNKYPRLAGIFHLLTFGMFPVSPLSSFQSDKNSTKCPHSNGKRSNTVFLWMMPPNCNLVSGLIT